MTLQVKTCGCSLCQYATEKRLVAIELRCGGIVSGKRCNRLLAEAVTPPYRLRCGRCGFVNQHRAVP